MILYCLPLAGILLGGALTWKGGMGMCRPQYLIFTFVLTFTRPHVEAQVRSQDPHLRHKSVHRTLIWKKNGTFSLQSKQFSLDMTSFSSRSSNLTASFIKKLETFAKISSKAPVFNENPLTSPCFQGNLSAHKPPSSEIRATPHMPTRRKVEYPLVGLGIPSHFHIAKSRGKYITMSPHRDISTKSMHLQNVYLKEYSVILQHLFMT